MEEIINLIGLSAGVCITFASPVAFSLAKAKLQRRSPKTIKLIGNSSEFLNELPEFSIKEINYENKEVLKDFIDRLVDYVNKEDLKIIYRNIENIKLKSGYKSRFLKLTGYYTLYDNKICYSSLESLGHELLHASSTILDRKQGIEFSGFEQYNRKNSIGVGINEGYTELLNVRIFSSSREKIAYLEEVRIVRMLELFFEDEKEMTSMYFNCDLQGLINKLEKYAPYDEIIKLITDIDDYFIYNDSSNFLSKQISPSIYKRIYTWFISSTTDNDKIAKMEEIINEEEYIANYFIKDTKSKVKRIEVL